METTQERYSISPSTKTGNMNKALGFRPRRALAPRGLCYMRRMDGNAIRPESMARLAASILEHMTGEECDAIPTAHKGWFIVRAVGEKWVRV